MITPPSVLLEWEMFQIKFSKKIKTQILCFVDCGGSVRTATRYWRDGLGIESRRRRDFPHPSRPALESTQPPMQRVPGLSWGVKRPGRGVDRPPLFIAEFKDGVQLYLYALFWPLWPLRGWPSPLPLPLNILYSVTPPPPQIVPFMRSCGKDIGRCRPQTAIWRMRFAWWIPTATDTHWE